MITDKREKFTMKKLMFLSLATLLMSAEAFAQTAGGGGGITDKGLFAIGLGIMLGIGAFGATMGQGRVGSSAMEGLARNPQARDSMFVPMILGLVLIESLFILTWLLAFLMFPKM
jgi:F-type H+-transporting ATPase subunit c